MASYYDSDRSGEFGFGGPISTAGLVGVCIHTTESGKSATATARTADDVTSYQIRTKSGSYNVMVGVDGKRILQNTDDWQTWSTGNKGNNILLHVCVVGNASQTRAEWVAQDKMLRAVGSVVGYWCRKYRWPLRKVGVNGLPGICGHVDTRAWGGTDHTDPGPNFPYDKVIEYAKGGAAPAKPVVNEIDAEAKIAAAWIGKRLHDGERKCKDGVGRYADFENGSIYWHPKVASGKAIAVPTNIYQAWEARGWEQGDLGYPVKRHTGIKDQGDVQAFQGGILYRRYNDDGHVVHGVIGNRWATEGFEAGQLGWPTSDEYDHDDGKKQDFEHGSLIWSPSGAVKEMKA